MADIDQGALDAAYQQASPNQDSLDAAYFAAAQPPGPARSALGEIGTSALRGVFSGAPGQLGQAIQFAGREFNAPNVQQFGSNLSATAEKVGQNAFLAAHPEGHGQVVQALSQGAESLGTMAPSLAVGALAGGGIGALALPSVLTAGQAGEQTQEKAEKAGVAPEQAHTAASLNALQTLATQAALGAVGGKMLGVLGNGVSRAIGSEGANLAEDVMGQLTGSQGVLAPFLKQLPGSALEATGVGAAQAATQAAIEQHYGIDNTDPLQAAKDSIIPMLGLTAVASPLGLVSRALQVRSARERTATLSNAETAPDLREALAQQYAQAIHGANPDAAQAFLANARQAIADKQPLQVDSSLFTPGLIQALPPEVQEGPLFNQQPLALPYYPEGVAAPQTFVGTPGGQVAGRGGVEAYINNLPEDQRVAARAELWGHGAQPAAPEPAPAPLALPYYPEPVKTDFIGTPEGATIPAGADTLGLDTARSVIAARDSHAQVRDALVAAGAEPAVPMTSAEFRKTALGQGLKGARLMDAYRQYLSDPRTERDLMYQDAEQYDALQQSQQEQARSLTEADAVRAAEPTPDINTARESQPAPPVPERINTQLSDALREATRQWEIDQAHAQVEGQKAAETEAIANVSKGAEQAAAAERGEIQPDINAPKQADEIASDVAAVNAEQGFSTLRQSMAPFEKRLDTVLDGAKTHQDQIDAVQAALDDPKAKMSDAIRDRMSALLDKWKAEQPPEQQVAQAVEQAQQEPAAPGLTEPQPEASKQAINGADNLTLSVADRKANALDDLNQLAADFNARIRGGEILTPAEQARFQDIQGVRRALAGTETPTEVEMKGFEQDAKDLAQPSERPSRSLETSDQVTPGLIQPTGMLKDTIAHLAQNGSQPWVRDLANKLAPLVSDVRLNQPGDHPNGDAGVYNPNTRTVSIYTGGESEHAILHEAIHAATERALSRAEAIAAPTNQYDAQLRKAYNDLDKVRREVMSAPDAKNQYGLTDVHEFVAELDSNPKFQSFLKDSPKGWWGRTVDAVRNLFGLSVDSRNALERAMEARDRLYSNLSPQRSFDASPQGAAKVTDAAVHALTKQADDNRLMRGFDTVDRATFPALLSAKTEDFIAHQLRVWPKMVEAGLSRAVDEYRAMRDSAKIVTEQLGDTLGKFAAAGQHALFKTDNAVEWGKRMTRIANEASIGEFDYRKNFADNLKDGRQLDPGMKGWVDQVHRDFAQLKATYPELAKAIEDGEKLNRKNLIQTVSVVAKTLLEDAAGVTQRLEAELQRLPLDSAERARMQDRIDLARTHSDMALKHAKGLDIMDKALESMKNSKTDFFADGASSALYGRLAQVFDDARRLTQGDSLRGDLGELERMYKAQVANPYFSLGRNGDYFVNVKFQNMDAATQTRLEQALSGTNKILGDLTRPGAADHAFFRFDSAEEAKGVYQKLLAAGGNKIDVGQSATGLLADRDMMSAYGVTPALRQMVERMHDSIDSDPAYAGQDKALLAAQMKATMTRAVLSMLPETSARSAKMQRRGIPGYDGNFFYNYAKRANGAVQDLAHLYTARGFSEALGHIDEAVSNLNRSGDFESAVRGQMVADEFNKHHANSMTKLDNGPINLLNSLSHTMYLAASPAFYIRTMAQPWHRGIPHLGAQYGFMKAAAEIAKATPTALRIIGTTLRNGWTEAGLRGMVDANMAFENMGLNQGDKDFLREMHTRGVLKLGMTQQLQADISRNPSKWRDVAALASLTAQYAEMTNRIITGLAAWHLSSSKMAPERAMNWSHDAINWVMDNFDTENTARALGKFGPLGKATPLVTRFMNYEAQTIQQIVRSVQDGYFSKGALPGESDQAFAARKSIARKEFMGLMGTTMMISGALGLPFVNAFAGVYNMLSKDRDDPHDVRGDVRNFLTSTLGTGLGNMLAHGLPAGANFDTSTFGLQDLLPGSSFLADRRQAKDALDAQSQQLLGPALNAGMDLYLGYHKIADGYLVKGIEQMLPNGLKSYYKAAELAGVIGVGGYTDSKGNPIGLPAPTGWDIGLQAAGFRTAEKATADEARMEFDTNEQLRQVRRAAIEDQLFKAFYTGDEAAQGKALDAMSAFNDKNPYAPIMDVAGALRQRYQQLAIGQMTGFGIPLTRRQIPLAQQEIGYAAMPTGQ